MAEIKVSAIVSTYNSERFIRGCLEDLISQTLYEKGELEIIVINSGSEQDEDSIIKEFHEKYQNIKYIKTELREGVYTAWNRGIKAASGKFITNANTDDRHRFDALEIMSDSLIENEKISVVYADSKVTKYENQTFKEAEINGLFFWPEYNKENLFRICYLGPQPMWRKHLHDKYGFFDENYKSAGDYEFWLRLAADNIQFKHINEFLGLYLFDESSVEHKNQNTSIIESEKARENYWNENKKRPVPSGMYLVNYEEYNKKENPFFSIVIPTFNRKEKLKSAIESVSKQTFKDYEVIIINDGDEDLSDIISQYSNKITLKYINNIVRFERSISRNNAIKASEGKYITFLDDDDIYFENHLQTIYENLEEKYAVYYTDAYRAVYQTIDKDDYLLKYYIPYSMDYSGDKVLIGNIAPLNCFAVERNIIFESGLFNETITVLEDWEFFIRLSFLSDFKHIKVPTCEVYWNIDEGTTTSERKEHFTRVRNQIYSYYAAQIKKIEDVDLIVEEFNEIWKIDFNIKEPEVAIVYKYLSKSNFLEYYEKLKKGELQEFVIYLVNISKIDFNSILENIKDIRIILISNHIRFDKLFENLKQKTTVNNVAFINFTSNELPKQYSSNNKNLSSILGTDKIFNLSQREIKKEKTQLGSEENESSVDIVVPLFNNWEYTEAFIKHLNFHIINKLILVDNNSSDDTVKNVKKLNNNKIQLIENKKNNGFPKAVNQGIKHAKAEFVLISNNDIILPNGSLERMIEIADESKDCSIVSGLSNFVSGVQLDKNAQYQTLEEMYQYSNELKQKNKGQYFEFPRVAFLCTLIKKEVIDKIGGLDERFSPGNYEDDDFCLRAQIAGFKTVVAKDVFIHHFGSKSFKADGEAKYAERLRTNAEIFRSKWNSTPDNIWLKGENVKRRNIKYPLNSDEAVEKFERAHILIEDEDFGLAKQNLNECLELLDSKPHDKLSKELVQKLIQKLDRLN